MSDISNEPWPCTCIDCEYERFTEEVKAYDRKEQ